MKSELFGAKSRIREKLSGRGKYCSWFWWVFWYTRQICIFQKENVVLLLSFYLFVYDIFESQKINRSVGESNISEKSGKYYDLDCKYHASGYPSIMLFTHKLRYLLFRRPINAETYSVMHLFYKSFRPTVWLHIIQVATKAPKFSLSCPLSN